MGEDFSAASPLEITFTPGVNEDMACAMVSIIDDTALEGDHSFSVTLASTVPPITINNTLVEVTIMDNEGTYYVCLNRRATVHSHIFLVNRCDCDYCVL